jgi:tRNA dimethylallyltransferase
MVGPTILPDVSTPVVAIFGPTGVGKTEVALALRDRLRAEGEDPGLVSADALQVYAGLEILTGAADAADAVTLTGVLDVSETFSAGAYAERAHAAIDALIAQDRRPIVVGGTGLYLRAALGELDLRPPADPAHRARWNAALDAEGAAALHARLAQRDPDAAVGIPPTDGRRIVRALELLDAGHAPPPAAGGASQLWARETRHPTLLAGLTMERDALRARIAERVHRMVEQGAAEEVRRADAAGASHTARKALGFQELLDGDVDAMVQRTQRYARRQLTWMRKLPDARLVDVTGRSAQDVAEEVLSALRTAAASTSPPM